MKEETPRYHSEPAGARHFRIIEQLKESPETVLVDVIKNGGFQEGLHSLRLQGAGVELFTQVIIAPKTPKYGTSYDDVLNRLGETLQVEVEGRETSGWKPSFFDSATGRMLFSEGIGTRKHSQTTTFSFEDPSVVANLGYPEATDFEAKEEGRIVHTTEIVLLPDAELAELVTQCLSAIRDGRAPRDGDAQTMVVNLTRYLASETKVKRLKKELKLYKERFSETPIRRSESF